MLILTCNEDKRTPSKYFREVYENLTNVEGSDFELSEFEFKDVKNVNLKGTFSFTSHIVTAHSCMVLSRPGMDCH